MNKYITNAYKQMGRDTNMPMQVSFLVFPQVTISSSQSKSPTILENTQMEGTE